MQTFIQCHVTLHVSGVTHPSSGVLKTVSATSGVCHAVKIQVKINYSELNFVCLLTVDSNVWFCVYLFADVYLSNVVTIYTLKLFV